MTNGQITFGWKTPMAPPPSNGRLRSHLSWLTLQTRRGGLLGITHRTRLMEVCITVGT